VVLLSRFELELGAANRDFVLLDLYLATNLLGLAAMLWLKSFLVDGALDFSPLCLDPGVLLRTGTSTS
jgi:hypothetical protein